jgi:hypothetical protein
MSLPAWPKNIAAGAGDDVAVVAEQLLRATRRWLC